MAAFIVAFLVWEFMLALLFVPLNFLYQSMLLLLATTILFEITLDYLGGRLTRRRTLINFSTFLVLAVIILGSAQWGL